MLMDIQKEGFEVKQTNVAYSNVIHGSDADIDSVGLETCNHGSAELILLENGMILACNKAGVDLLGYAPSELRWQHISRLLPQLSEMSLILDEKINPYLRFLSAVGHRFEVMGTNGTHIACELFFSIVEEFGRCCLRITMQPVRQGRSLTLRHLRTY
jgi:PAS domain-containing protein